MLKERQFTSCKTNVRAATKHVCIGSINYLKHWQDITEKAIWKLYVIKTFPEKEKAVAEIIMTYRSEI